ncbi:MAG: low molecular weight phosphatase family protein [Flavobacterium sp.]
MYSEIKDFIQHLDVHAISEERQATLQPLIAFIQMKVDAQEEVSLNFICTHNSRRSHLSQLWAQVMAAHFSVPKVTTYSGGTEATAMFPKVAETLVAQGFEIHALSEGQNPVYAVKYDENAHPVIGFSKTFDHSFNPTSHFAAIMTCSSADVGCPFIAGAEKRIPITFDDPKAFDGTPQQAEKYKERSVQIATELFYVFSKIK